MLFTLVLFSAKNLLAQSLSCDSIENAQDILNCVIENHPDIQRANAQIEVSKTSFLVAKQRPNPEVEVRELFSAEPDKEDFLSEINLSHTLELGGKRKNRIRQARAYEQLSSAITLSVKEKAVLNTVLVLHRLRQLQTEFSLLNETVHAFENIRTLYQKRPILDPEQQTSLTVFGLAEKEMRLKKVSLTEEEISIFTYLQKATHRPLSFSKSFLPKKKWPNLNVSNSLETIRGSVITKPQAELEQATSSLKAAKSGAWPNLKLGPSVETEEFAGESATAVGFNLSLSLPIFHQNQGEKREAFFNQEKAKLDLQLTQLESVLERKKLIQTYQQIVKILRVSKPNELKLSHQEIDSFFERGLVSSALVLETHKQMVESQERFHILELKAIEALWKVYALEGRILQEKI